jgi:hypothetical protein
MGKWFMPFILAITISMPLWAADLKLAGNYGIQGMYYANPFIKNVSNDSTYPSTGMYQLYYSNLYPANQGNYKIRIEGKK